MYICNRERKRISASPDLIALVVEMTVWNRSGIEKVKLWLVLSQNKSLDEFLRTQTSKSAKLL